MKQLGEGIIVLTKIIVKVQTLDLKFSLPEA